MNAAEAKVRQVRRQRYQQQAAREKARAARWDPSRPLEENIRMAAIALLPGEGSDAEVSNWPAPIPAGCPYRGWTRKEDSWFSPSITDLSEPFHRVDLLIGRFYCTCQGYQRWKRCQHCSRALAEVMDEMINESEESE